MTPSPEATDAEPSKGKPDEMVLAVLGVPRGRAVTGSALLYTEKYRERRHGEFYIKGSVDHVGKG